MKNLLLLSVLLTACNADIDMPWELDHDRIIAVRAEPPGILPGQQSRLDLFAGYETLPAETRRPDFARVVSPESLTNTVSNENGEWIVTAPSAAELDVVRGELGLPADAPVPLVVGVAAAWPTPVMAPEGNGFAATKTVWLGKEHANPTLEGLTIDGIEPPDEGGEIVFSAAMDYKTRIFVDANDETQIVNWLSSCCEVHDFDLHSGYVTVSPDDHQTGQFAVVFHDELGGVTWRLWTARAE